MKATVVTSVKNESPNIVEWVVFNRIIGFQEIIVFYNDCTDGTEDVLQALHDEGLIQSFENKGKSELPPQVAAFAQARDLPCVKAADWAIALDVDEFINIKCGNHRLVDLFSRIPDADAILIQMKHFGSGNHIFRPDGFVIENFTRCSGPDFDEDRIVKTLHRMGNKFRSIGMHMPFFFSHPELNPPTISNGSGIPIPREVHQFERHRKIPPGWSGQDVVQLNHYAVGSLDRFLCKRRRGSGTGMKNRFNREYWNSRNRNEMTDNSIRWVLDEMRSEVAAVSSVPKIRAALRRAKSLNDLETLAAVSAAPPFAIAIAEELAKAAAEEEAN